MEYVIKGYQPEKLFNFFEEISAIPRGSGNEKGIADYIEAFANERGLFCVRDSLHNVFIRKNATEGYENEIPVMLQGHTDMVCEQNEGTGHDFENEGLDLYIENGWLKARGTTLGGDDGVAVAIMLCILDDNTLCHPTVECLFTTGEETGLYGATGFDYSVVTSKKLINLDSEEEGVATISCAGGIDIGFTIKADRVPLPTFVRPLMIELSGLTGGHSGAEIHLQRGNANILMSRILNILYEKHPFTLVTVSGGTRGNAIPREAKAVIFTDEPAVAEDTIKSLIPTVKSWLPKEDKHFKLRISKAKGEYNEMLTFADTVKYLTLTNLMPDGVIAMMNGMADMVETSNNLGVVRDNGEEGIHFTYHGRSSSDSKTDNLEITAKRLAKALDVDLKLNGRYSGWPMKDGSELAKQYCEAVKTVCGENVKPRLAAIHAGLECGIICSHVEGMDAISIGPELKGIHAPGEALELCSMERLYGIVCELIAMK